MIWNFIQQKLSDRIDVILLLVIETKGSCPGKKGFKMAVAADGPICGTLGGGNMEFNMVELARKQLANKHNREVSIEHLEHKHDSPKSSGMICSGEQKILFFPITPNYLEQINRIVSALDMNKCGLLAIEEKNMFFFTNEDDKHNYHKSENWIYSEMVGEKDTVYIFGAGHISVPLSEILSMLDFKVEVFDNRQQLITFNSNTFAHIKRVIDYNEAAKYVSESDRSYVAIMTFGHSFDEVVLKQFLPKKLKYLGMIGSKSKVNEIFDNLVQNGFTQEQVDRVCSPIGISIGGNSAAEIAVSIAAQIVQYRNM